jgi:hypothetical protein
MGCTHASILIFHGAYRASPLQDLHQAWLRPADGLSAFGPRERRQVGTVRPGCTLLVDPFFGKDRLTGSIGVAEPGVLLQSPLRRAALQFFIVQGQGPRDRLMSFVLFRGGRSAGGIFEARLFGDGFRWYSSCSSDIAESDR